MATSFSIPLRDPARVAGPDWPDRFLLDRFVSDDQITPLRGWGDRLDPSVLAWPLVLYGPSGGGKTSLALMLAARLAEQSRGDRPATRFISAKDFVHDLVEAFDTKSVAEFRRRIDGVHILIIDGLSGQDLSAEFQQELAQLLDRRMSSGQAILLTCAVPPWRDRQLNPQLASRLSQGLAVEVTLPGRTARREILELLCRRLCMQIESSGFDYLADTWSCGAERLHQKLANLSIQAGRGADKAWTRRQLQELVASRAPETKQAGALILKATAHEFHTNVASLRGPTRRREIVQARAAAILLFRRVLGLSFAQIGRLLGGRDQSTIRHAYQSAVDKLSKDPLSSAKFQDLRHRVSNEFERWPSPEPFGREEENVPIDLRVANEPGRTTSARLRGESRGLVVSRAKIKKRG